MPISARELRSRYGPLPSRPVAELRVYTTCVGSGEDRYLMLPEAHDTGPSHYTLSEARAMAAQLRTAGARGVYIIDHRTGQAVR